MACNITHSEDNDSKPEFFMITFIDRDGKLNFCESIECGYPYVSTDFTFDMVYYSENAAQRDIDCWTKFNMWKPGIGFTAENIKIQKLVMYLTNVQKD